MRIRGERVRVKGNFKQTEEIMYKIRQNLTEIKTPLKIGMVFGLEASIACENEIRKLDFAIDLIIKTVKEMGLSIEKQNPIISSTVIVDTENLLLKTEYSKNKKKVYNI